MSFYFTYGVLLFNPLFSSGSIYFLYLYTSSYAVSYLDGQPICKLPFGSFTGPVWTEVNMFAAATNGLLLLVNWSNSTL